MENLNNQGNEQLEKLKEKLDLIEYPIELDKMPIGKPYKTDVIIGQLFNIGRIKSGKYSSILQIIDYKNEDGENKFKFRDNWNIIIRVK